MKNLEQIKHYNYEITFEIKGMPLNIIFKNYIDYSISGSQDIEEFIIYLIRRCINVQAFMDENDNSLFAHNIKLWNIDEKTILYCIERSLQLHP